MGLNFMIGTRKWRLLRNLCQVDFVMSSNSRVTDLINFVIISVLKKVNKI